MRFTSLTVENFRGVKHAHLEFGPRLTVLYGPNDLGKSTLVTALRSALLLPSGSTEGGSFVPWYEEAVPTVTLAFVTDDQRHWKVVKKWGAHPAATLFQSKDGKDWLTERLDGRQVEERLRRLVELGIPAPGGKGAPRGVPTSFLTNALLAGQTDVDAVLAASLDRDLAEGGRVRLTQALAALGQDPLFASVLETANEEVDRYFTATGRVRRTQHSPIARAGEVVRALTLEAEQLAAQVEEMGAVETAAATLRERKAELQAQVEGAEAELVTRRSGFAASRGRAELEERVARARASVRVLDERAAALASRAVALAEEQRALTVDRRGVTALGANVQEAKQALEGAEASLRAAQSEDGRATRELERSTLLLQKAKLEAELARVQARQKALAEARARFEQAAELGRQVATLTAGQVRAEAALNDAQVALATAQHGVELAAGAEAYGRWRAAVDAHAKANALREEQVTLRAEAERGRALVGQLEAQRAALARELEQQRARLPDPATLARLNQLEQDLTLARASLGGGVSVTVRARRELSLRSAVDEHRAVDEGRVQGEREFEAERRVTPGHRRPGRRRGHHRQRRAPPRGRGAATPRPGRGPAGALGVGPDPGLGADRPTRGPRAKGRGIDRARGPRAARSARRRGRVGPNEGARRAARIDADRARRGQSRGPPRHGRPGRARRLLPRPGRAVGTQTRGVARPGQRRVELGDREQGPRRARARPGRRAADAGQGAADRAGPGARAGG